MSSTRRPIRLHGFLKGDGGECTCEIGAIRVSLDGVPGEFHDINYRIIQTSKDLPEGRYICTVNNERMPVQLVGGQWLSDE